MLSSTLEQLSFLRNLGQVSSHIRMTVSPNLELHIKLLKKSIFLEFLFINVRHYSFPSAVEALQDSSFLCLQGNSWCEPCSVSDS